MIFQIVKLDNILMGKDKISWAYYDPDLNTLELVIDGVKLSYKGKRAAYIWSQLNDFINSVQQKRNW